MITINMSHEDALAFIKERIEVPFQFELTIDGVEKYVPVVQEPTLEEKLDVALVKREEMRRRIESIAEGYAGQVLICAYNMDSEEVRSFGNEEGLMGVPWIHWQGSKEHQDDLKAKSKAREEAEERKAKLRKDIEAQEARHHREAIRKQTDELYQARKAKYGDLSDFEDDWIRWEEEEEEHERKKKQEEADIKKYKELDIPMPYKPQYTNKLFEFDGKTREEWNQEKLAQQKKFEEEVEMLKKLDMEGLGNMLAEGMDEFKNDLPGAKPKKKSSLARSLEKEVVEAEKRRLNEQKSAKASAGGGLFGKPVTYPTTEVVLSSGSSTGSIQESKDDDEGFTKFETIPDAKPSSLFAGIAPIVPEVEQQAEPTTVPEPVKSEPVVEAYSPTVILPWEEIKGTDPVL